MPKDKPPAVDPMAAFDPSADVSTSTVSLYIRDDLANWAQAQAEARGWSRNRFLIACIVATKSQLDVAAAAAKE